MNIPPHFLFLAVFTVWCYFGLVWFEVPPQWRFMRAVTFGLIRFVLFFTFRFLLFYVGMMIEGLLIGVTAQRILTYVFLYLPSIWVEWCIVAALMTTRWTGIRSFLLGPWKPFLRWKLYGSLMTVALEFPQSFLWQALLRSFPPSS